MKKYSFLLILAAGSLWGTMGVFVDLLTSLGFSTMNAALLRICSAAVMYVIFLLVKDKKLLVIHNAKGISPSAEGDEGFAPSTSLAFLPAFLSEKSGAKELDFFMHCSAFACWHLWHTNAHSFAKNIICYFRLLVRVNCCGASPQSGAKKLDFSCFALSLHG